MFDLITGKVQHVPSAPAVPILISTAVQSTLATAAVLASVYVASHPLPEVPTVMAFVAEMPAALPPPPPPPPNVDPIPTTAVDSPKATLRMKLEAHMKDPNCAACHRKIDPLGLAFENYDAIGQEVTVVNSVGDRGETSGSGGLATPVSYGVAITAPAGYRNTAAILVTGPGSAVFNRGIAFSGGSINQATFQDLTSAPISVEVQGAHTYGVDMASATFSGAAIRLPFGYKIKSRNGTNSADINLIQAGAGGGDATFVGDTANVAVVINNHCVPVADNTYTCGWGIGRWSAVWAVNGTIQTSDPSLKDDIAFLADLPPGTAGRLVAAISPITFRWKVGGRDADGAEIPGKRTHWGWNAAEVKSAFDAIGKDFGGYVRDENGVQHLRPDQLVPVLWQAVKDLTARVAALEAR